MDRWMKWWMWTGITVCIACMLSQSSHVQLCVTLWTAICQVPLFMGFSRHEYWSGLSYPPPGNLPNARIRPVSLASPALAGGFFATPPSGKPRLEVSLSKRWKLFTSPLVRFIGESCLSAKYLQSYGIAWFRPRARQPQQLNIWPTYIKGNDLNCAVWVSSSIK